MRLEHPSRSRSRSPSSSFGKTSQDYPLAVFDPNENDSESSQFITVGRESFDSARPDQRETTNEPLLPTSTHHPRRIAPEPFSCTLSGICAWVKGPPYPHRYQITPWLQRWQTAPGRLVERYLPSTRAKVWLLLGCICTWGVIFLSILHSSVVGQQVSGYGVPVKLSCHARLWPNSTDCGLNGDSCRPFDDGAFAFRCPASCADAMLLEPYFVGPQEYNYRPLVIGGTADGDNTDAIYRGDSAICPAALHAGLIDSQKGGCGVLRRTGERTKFPSVIRNGIESIGYASYFPLSFTFGEESSETSCQDLRWPLFTFSVVVTTLLSLFITSPAAFYASIYFIVYFQVALSSDPPYSPDYYEVVSTALGRLLPCAFVGFAMYYFCVRKTLTDLTAHWDKTVLWLGSCWVGALNTDTFDKIPISRLTPHDIQQQPGAIPALIIIVGLLVAIVLTQAIAFRREGRMPKMLLLYGIMVCGVIALMLVPHMNLRIHHYVLSLLFLPGTALQTRPSLLYQGLLIGLFINGIARWGFDSILQTSAALLDGAQLGSVLPVIGAPAILSSQNIMFNFNDVDKDADGISVLVNDVERFRAFKSDDGMLESFNWTRHLENEPEYFRFGYIKVNALGGIWYEDFTRPGTWESEGDWVPPDADSGDDSGSVSPSLA